MLSRRRHHRRDAVDGELAHPAGRRIVGGQLAAADIDRRHHPLRGHPGGVDVADHHRRLVVRGLLQLRDRDGRVEPHVAERGGAPPCAAPRRSRRASGRWARHRPVDAAARRCRHPGAAGTDVDDRAGGVLGRGREAGVAQRGEHLGDRGLRHRDRRREQPHLQLLGGGCGDGLRQQRRVLASHERRRHADPQLPVAACDVVDQIRQPLRHRRFRVPLEQARAARWRCVRCRGRAGSRPR